MVAIQIMHSYNSLVLYKKHTVKTFVIVVVTLRMECSFVKKKLSTLQTDRQKEIENCTEIFLKT